MRNLFSTIVVFGLLSSPVFAADGLISLKSVHSVSATADRLEKTLGAKGMTVFNRIDHAAGAASVGNSLRPTELIIFGNPKIGSALMQCSQSIAVDLPQKTLIWQDENDQVWVSYNDPKYLARRHNTQGCDAVLDKVSAALANFAKQATGE